MASNTILQISCKCKRNYYKWAQNIDICKEVMLMLVLFSKTIHTAELDDAPHEEQVYTS